MMTTTTPTMDHHLHRLQIRNCHFGVWILNDDFYHPALLPISFFPFLSNSPVSSIFLWSLDGFFQTPYHHHRSITTVVAWFKGQSGKRICFRKIWKVKLCTIFQIVTKDLTDMISLAPWKDNPYQGLMWLTRELAGQTVFSLLTVLSDLSMFFYIFEVVDHFAKGHRIQNHGHSPLLSCCFCPFNVLKFKHGFWKLWTNGKDKWKLRSCSVVTCDSF
ncbi:hypothetical protein L2E82_05557 [Cichorium intybus]|uniref:Uncharacterized protein n=1 Tax=Cichorium intybus TaxID=13427 RepID=A0ACB9H8W6_CICIN|nr:hypothetical protein L2E82_05557 [Cichorium intybus]